MAKTCKNLFEKIITGKNLLIAFQNASAQKRFRNTILNFEKNLAENILELLKNLSDKTYQHGGYRRFCLFDPKEREISAAPFQDRVIHHAICKIMEPIFDKKFIYDSFACRKTKGSHKAIERLQKFLIKNKEVRPFSLYALKCDVSKCFLSVNHEILLKILNKKIKDKNAMRLLKEIVSSYESDDKYNNLFPPDSHFRTKRPRGIPIGNLTSQLFVNIYLNELDQYLKHHLKVKYYVRYVDDFIILAKNKKYLRQLAEKIRTFLYTQLYLTLHPKKMRIFPSHLGIDFLGYLIFKDHIRLRASNVKAFRKKLIKFRKLYLINKISQQKIQKSITSWLAHAEHADTYNLRKALFGLWPDGDSEGKPLGAKNQKEIIEFIYSWKHSSEKPICKPSGQLRLF
ncbi:MAG: reverse transcriptase/maturase family protein [Patescibacteria group bacterium]|nr:reverse transcriptase/maturase family protein [Patescibacteria group bacterium]